ncbi:MAG: hemolysin family protein [Planctomycetota bacterium]|nr:hemolysin family protein [Planctomycetota bacterium]MDP6939305.1 hemolysin family protein [Planctomycetota bacterium]
MTLGEALPWLGASSMLLSSGFLAGAETALFSLGEEQVAAARPRVRKLLSQPRELLVTILLGNLFINLLFFTSLPYLFPSAMQSNALVTGAQALLALLVVGEIVPKTIALRSSERVSSLVAVPLVPILAWVRPLRRVVNAIMDVLLRAFGVGPAAERGVSPQDLATALELSAKDGDLAGREADLLAEIVELGHLRVREIMTPRVDMLAADLDHDVEQRAHLLEATERQRLTWLPVIRGDADTVVGRVDVRDMLLEPDRPLAELIMPVTFVPEVASVLSMLEVLRAERVAEAIVIDEWGGTAGVVTLEDLFEELVGEMRVEGEEIDRVVIPLGEGCYRVSGGASIRDWNDFFEAEVVPNAFETVGGYVAALLGRIPREGDQVILGAGLACKITEVRGRRVLSVELYLEGSQGGDS